MEHKENKNKFLITWISCIVFLLTLCILGVNSSIKGTSATDGCSNKITYNNNEYCCSTGYDTIVKDSSGTLYCVKSSETVGEGSSDGGYMCDSQTSGLSETTAKSNCTSMNGSVGSCSENNNGVYVCDCTLPLSSCGEEAVPYDENSGTGKLKLDANGGQILPDISEVDCTIISGSNICYVTSGNLPIVYRSGWTFNGWTASVNCSTNSGSGTIENGVYTNSFTLSSTVGGTMYACWKKTSKLKLVYADDTDNVIASEICNRYNGDNTSCTYPVPQDVEPLSGSEKTKFVGWDNDSSCDTMVTLSSGHFNFTDLNRTYYACFEKEASNPSPPSNPGSGEEDKKMTIDASMSGNNVVGGRVQVKVTTSPEADECHYVWYYGDSEATKKHVNPDGSENIDWDHYNPRNWQVGKYLFVEATCSLDGYKDATIVKQTSTVVTEESDEEIKEDTKPSEDKDGNVTENQPTGENTLIAIIWFFGLLTIGYAYYYFKEVKNH